jgi:hypothetical protein
MACRPSILQLLRIRASGIGRTLLPAVAVTLLCPAGVVCAEVIVESPHGHDAAAHTHDAPARGHAAATHSHGNSRHDHGGAAHEHDAPTAGNPGGTCPHCPTQASAMSSARPSCDVPGHDAPPPKPLHADAGLPALHDSFSAVPITPHPSPPRTAYSTGSGPSAVPLNLLHCVFLN